MVERGRSKYNEGDTLTAPNGYRYIYLIVDGRLQRILFHHHVGFKKYGRWPRDHERVVFVDGDRRNFRQENIEYRVKSSARQTQLARRQRIIKDKIQELQAEYAENQKEMNSIREEGTNGD